MVTSPRRSHRRLASVTTTLLVALLAMLGLYAPPATAATTWDGDYLYEDSVGQYFWVHVSNGAITAYGLNSGWPCSFQIYNSGWTVPLVDNGNGTATATDQRTNGLIAFDYTFAADGTARVTAKGYDPGFQPCPSGTTVTFGPLHRLEVDSPGQVFAAQTTAPGIPITTSHFPQPNAPYLRTVTCSLSATGPESTVWSATPDLSTGPCAGTLAAPTELAPGSYGITASYLRRQGENSQSGTVSTTLTVLANPTPTVPDAYASTTGPVSASGWPAADCSVSVDGGTPVTGTVTDGICTANITAPSTAGSHPVSFTSTTGLSYSTTMQVYAPALSVPSPVTHPVAAAGGLVISGSGFIPNTTVKVQVDDGVMIDEFAVDAAGEFSFTSWDAWAAGSHIVSTLEGPNASASFVVESPIIEVNPLKLSSTDPTGVTLGGVGFPAGETTIQIGSLPATTVEVGSDGLIELPVPGPLAPRTYPVTVTSLLQEKLTTSFEVFGPPNFTLTPSELTHPQFATTGIQLLGTGYLPNQAYDVEIDGQVPDLGSRPASGLDGALSFVLAGLPLAAGEHTVQVGGFSQQFTILPPAVNVSPAQLQSTDTAGVTITGTGFPPGTCTIEASGLPAVEVPVAQDGTCSHVFAGPLSAGVHSVTVTSSLGEVATGQFEVAQPQPPALVPPGPPAPVPPRPPTPARTAPTTAAPRPTSLPKTGAEGLPLTTTALGITALGALLLARRPRKA